MPGFRMVAVVIGLVGLLGVTGALQAGGGLVRDDGIHTEPWIKAVTFLDLAEDLAEAKANGKMGLALLFEQNGCGACARLHGETFSDAGLVHLLTSRFDVIQINTHGAVDVTDFDGETLSERAFSIKRMALFTPTTVFFGADGKEIFRVPGVLELEDYRAVVEYVTSDGPGQGVSLVNWLKDHRDGGRPRGGG